MKVLRISQEYYPLISGPTKQAHNISRGLIRKGHESPVLTTTAGTELPPGPDRIDEVSIERLAARGRIMRCYFVPSLHRELDLTGIDVVHVHGWRNYLSEYTMRRARRAGIPIVLHAHGGAGLSRRILSGPARIPYRAYDLVRRRAVIEATDVLIAATAQERDEAIEYGFAAERIAVIPAGIDSIPAEERHDEAGAPLGPVRLLFVGRLAADRNVEQIIRAVGRLRDAWTDVTLRVVGPEERRTSLDAPGYVDRLRRLATELRVNDRVTFAGERLGPNLDDEYASADIFVSTSRYENFGNAVLEAAAHGLPIVTTPTGVGPELVAATGAGAVVDVDDEAATAEAIGVLVRNPASRLAAGAVLRTHLDERYTWPSVVTRYLDLYGQLLERSRGRVGVALA